MGQVFLAQDTRLERPVAIKVISALVPDDEARLRFLVEARAAARLSHPNVVTVYRVGEVEQHLYIASEFVAGMTLDQVEKPLPLKDVVEFGKDLARALDAAHRSGILHRDIKAANAIIGELDDQLAGRAFEAHFRPQTRR